MLLNTAEISKYVASAMSDTSEVVVEACTRTFFPFYDAKTCTTLPSVAYVARVKDGEKTYSAFLAAMMYQGELRFSFACSDKFLEGSLDKEQADIRIAEAVKGLSSKTTEKTMKEAFGSLPGSWDTPCPFWRNWRRAGSLCEHTSALLRQVGTQLPDFVTDMDSALTALTAQPLAAPTGFGLEELAFRVPVLFEGERGAGKTVTARAFARDNGYKRVELGGHEGLEAPDLLGFLVPVTQGALVWKDGPVSEAFRAARKQKVVLIIDELLRVRQRELSLLLTALSPDEGVYRLRTGRILSVEDGVATEEELECPVENLCIVATTNVGSEYAVDDIDPALAERFVVIRKDTTEEQLKTILSAVAKKKGLPVACAKQCVLFFSKMSEARARGIVRYAPTTRTLVRALELASTISEVTLAIKAQRLLWVARTGEGHPVPEQMTAVDALIERCFKV